MLILMMEVCNESAVNDKLCHGEEYSPHCCAQDTTFPIFGHLTYGAPFHINTISSILQVCAKGIYTILRGFHNGVSPFTFHLLQIVHFLKIQA